LFRAFTEQESGRRADRPQLRKAIETAKLYGAVLVVATLDRLTRNSKFLEYLLDEIENGLQVACTDSPIRDDPAGRFILRSCVAVAQMEAEMASKRTTAALAALKARGHVFKGRPGHRMPSDIQAAGPRRRAEIANEKAKIYRGVLDDIGDGSLTMIARELNMRQVPTPSGRGYWSATAVRRVQGRLA
jgi:DNA invertase Pin-like site-specific DNA recombinase